MNIAVSFVDGRRVEVARGETVLAACRRSAVPIKFSCGAGICHTCLLQVVEGEVPAAAQKGLADDVKRRNCVLACRCVPTQPMVLAEPDPKETRGAATELEPPLPDPALWQELGNGTVVEAVLRDFYARVHAAPQLAPFFENVTIQRSIEKQFSFLKQLATGERTYFGDRPRNAHHWMVISDELFDQRQALMHEVLVAHGLTPSQIARWERLEAHWRGDIVKLAPRPRRIDGIELPLEGYAQEVLSEGTLCDHCGAVLDAGTRVHYHLRLGMVSCPGCALPH
jgi:ferredoxin/truncated hemoglobin YjbI